MGKALMGSHVSPSSLRLLDEVRVLRQRVAELERALAQAQSASDERALDDHIADHAADGRSGRAANGDEPIDGAGADASDGRAPAHR